jgi:hypothetical protein
VRRTLLVLLPENNWPGDSLWWLIIRLPLLDLWPDRQGNSRFKNLVRFPPPEFSNRLVFLNRRRPTGGYSKEWSRQKRRKESPIEMLGMSSCFPFISKKNEKKKMGKYVHMWDGHYKKKWKYFEEDKKKTKKRVQQFQSETSLTR